MKKNQNNVAYIDGANLYKGIQTLEWEFDYGRFRVWLREKYGVEQENILKRDMQKEKTPDADRTT